MLPESESSDTGRELRDLSRLCIHTATTKPWSLRECIDGYGRIGAAGITVWRDALEPQGPEASRRMLDDSGLKVGSFLRTRNPGVFARLMTTGGPLQRRRQ